MTTVHERYGIACNICGHIETAKTFESAKRIAQHAKLDHRDSDEQITIFDRMAHYNRPDTFDINGNPITEYRG